MFWALCLAALAMAAQRFTRSGQQLASASACMPPMEPPTTACSRAIPRWSISATWARTMSATVMTGKRIAHGRPVPGSSLPGPVLPEQPPITLVAMMQWRWGSIGRPGPTMTSHQPGRRVIGSMPATCWFPVSAWHTRMALDASAFSSPQRV